MTHLLSVLLTLLLSMAGLDTATVSLLFAGDAMQHAPQEQAAARIGARNHRGHDYRQCFALLKSDIAAADYAVVNLETPLAGTPYSGYPAFSAPDAYAQELHRVGFDLLLTANNHCLDRRDRGLTRTIAALDRMGISHIGTYTSPAQRLKRLPFIVNVKGMRIAMLDYTYGTNGIDIQGNVVVDYIDRSLIAADIAEARAAGVDAICVNLHWGIEYQMQPSLGQTNLADWLVDQGVDLIIGGHPHVVQPMEMRYSARYNKNVLLVYSMGNFISNQTGIDSRGGAMVKVKLSRDMFGKTWVHGACYSLFFVQKPRGKYDNYVLIPENRPELVRMADRAEFRQFMSRARSLALNRNIGVPCEMQMPVKAETPWFLAQ